MLSLAKQNNLIEGIKFPYNGPELMNIQYTNDTLIFLSLQIIALLILREFYVVFKLVLGLGLIFINPLLLGLVFLRP